MRKLGVYVAMLLWVIAIINKGENNKKQENVFSVINSKNLTTECSEVMAFSVYGTDYLSLDAKEKILKSCADELGISDYSIDTTKVDERVTSAIVKNGKNALSTIKIVTMEEKDKEGMVIATNYLLVNIVFYRDSEAVYHYKEVLDKMYEKRGLEADIKTSIISSVKGNLDLKNKNDIADNILKEIDCEIISENRTNDLFTIYGYSKNIDDYISISGKKVNVNIAVSYDEINDKTLFYFATPIYNADY